MITGQLLSKPVDGSMQHEVSVVNSTANSNPFFVTNCLQPRGLNKLFFR